MGNSAIAGAYMALLSNTFREEAQEICNNMTYVEFSSNTHYMDEFTSPTDVYAAIREVAQ